MWDGSPKKAGVGGGEGNVSLFAGCRGPPQRKRGPPPRRVPLQTPGGASPAPTEDLAHSESRQDIIRVARLTRKPSLQAPVQRWTACANCAIIALWKLAAHNAELR